MRKHNLYKIIPIEHVKQEWFNSVVQINLDDCRKSLDGSLVLLKLPYSIQSEEDILDFKLKAEFIANKPYLNIDEVTSIMNSKEWIFNEDAMFAEKEYKSKEYIEFTKENYDSFEKEAVSELNFIEFEDKMIVEVDELYSPSNTEAKEYIKETGKLQSINMVMVSDEELNPQETIEHKDSIFVRAWRWIKSKFKK